jgi:hypothetical protein
MGFKKLIHRPKTKFIDQKQPNMRKNLTLCPSKAPRTSSHIVVPMHSIIHILQTIMKNKSHRPEIKNETMQHQAPSKPAINITTPSLLTHCTEDLSTHRKPIAKSFVAFCFLRLIVLFHPLRVSSTLITSPSTRVGAGSPSPSLTIGPSPIK